MSSTAVEWTVDGRETSGDCVIASVRYSLYSCTVVQYSSFVVSVTSMGMIMGRFSMAIH